MNCIFCQALTNMLFYACLIKFWLELMEILLILIIIFLVGEAISNKDGCIITERKKYNGENTEWTNGKHLMLNNNINVLETVY